MFDQNGGIDAAQIEPLAAGQNRHRHFADFRRGENEFGVRRWLFKRLEQRIESGTRKHVHFIEDIDLVACAHRRVANGVIDLPHVLDTVVRGGIHFQHIGVPAFDDGLAMHAHHRHLDCGFLHRTVRQFVIQRARENARSRGLADATHAGEDPGLRDATAVECVRDGAHHGVLPDQVIKAGRAVFAREHAIALGRCIRRSGTACSGFSGLAHRAIRFATAPRAASLQTNPGIGGRLTSDPNRAR